VTSNKDKMGLRRAPYVFTEQGVSMLSAILKSTTAVDMSVKIIRTFVNMKRFISANNTVFQRLETLEQNQLITNSNIDKIFTAIEAKTIKEQTSGIFFKDQMYDMHSFISDLLRKPTKSNIIETTKELVDRARLRMDIRNPPGKDDSLGDAINWEGLLNNVKKIKNYI